MDSLLLLFIGLNSKRLTQNDLKLHLNHEEVMLFSYSEKYETVNKIHYGKQRKNINKTTSDHKNK